MIQKEYFMSIWVLKKVNCESIENKNEQDF